jgi:hypothetical protein
MALAPIVSGITPVLGDALLVGQRWWPQRDSVRGQWPVSQLTVVISLARDTL